MLGFGLGFGVFLAPSDPNRYMRDWVRRAPPGFEPVSAEEPEFVLHYLPILSVDVGPLPWLRLQATTELAIGFNGIFVQDQSGGEAIGHEFYFTRFSEVVTANLEYPINVARTTNIFVGAGPGFHHMVFEEHSATTVGFRAQLGIGLLQEKVRADGVIGFDYVRARSDKDQAWFNGQEGRFMLDYTSLHLSAIIHFNVVR